jgi:hypothetical protein
VRSQRGISLYSLSIIAAFLLGLPAQASEADKFTARLIFLQGDVRVSLGHDGEPKIAKDWFAESLGMPVEAGYSIATQDGNTEIELENGSVIYLAPQSLLVFYELSAQDSDSTPSGEIDTAHVRLVSGTAIVLSQFQNDGQLTLETQTGKMITDRPSLERLTASLDDTELVDLEREMPRELKLDTQTPGVAAATFLSDVAGAAAKQQASDQDDPWSKQAMARVREHMLLTLAALHSSDLEAPFAGLVDLYQNGQFSKCGEAETCWAPSQEALSQLPASSVPASTTPSTAPQQAPAKKGLQLVSESYNWQEGPCINVWEHTLVFQDEKGKLFYDVRRNQAGPTATGNIPWLYAACTTGVPFHHHTLLRFDHDKDHRHHHHHETVCQWVKANGHVGIMRGVPIREKGRLALSSKNPVYLLPREAGEPVKRLEADSLKSVKALSEPPRQYRSEPSGPRVTAPAITAQYREANNRGVETAAAVSKSSLRQAVYDYKAHGFAVPGEGKTPATRPVVIAAMNSHGELSAPTRKNANFTIASNFRASISNFDGNRGNSGGHSYTNAGAANASTHSFAQARAGSWSSGGPSHSYSGGSSGSSAGGGSHSSSSAASSSSAPSAASAASAPAASGGGHTH